jgi:hypothetical protein
MHDFRRQMFMYLLGVMPGTPKDEKAHLRMLSTELDNCFLESDEDE